MLLSCPAKLNLALGVGPPRNDGMHPIASWMVSLAFYDELEIETLDAGPSQFEVSVHDEAPKAFEVDWPLEKDLMFRGHALLEETAGRELPVRISLRKRIPPESGLGGGSGNAAGVLVTLNRQFKLGLDEAAMCGLAAQLGSDVIFSTRALMGTKAALVTGVGDLIEPLPPKEIVHLVLILGDVDCPTGQIYRRFDQLMHEPQQHDTAGPDVRRIRQLAAKSPIPQDGPFNDLAGAAFSVRPALAELHGTVEASLELPVHVTGSGSAMYLIAPSAPTARSLARKVTATAGVPAIATRTL